jgi:2-succinyl-6-hydroxy-2,4-cyclohexadiene-1-carboxylate synthase
MAAILHHSELGPAGGPPIVLLHGFLGRAQDWEPTAARLAREFRCVAIDLPGHGRSLDLPPAAYTWDGALDALAATLDRLGLGRVPVAGYSMGGRLALGFALRHRRRVTRLALVGASPGFRDRREAAARAAIDDARAAEIAADLPGFVERWYRMPLFAPLAATPALLAKLTDTPAESPYSRLRNDPDELARALRGLSSGRMPDLWAHLDDIGAPTLAIAGARDRKFVEIAHRMAATGRPIIPLTLPAAGHMLPLEQPAPLADAIASFCSEPIPRRQPGPALVVRAA